MTAQPVRSELTPTQERELSVGLLRSWWISATQTLVETVGSEEALNFLKPYFFNSGKAGAYHIKELTGLPTSNAGEIVALWIGIANYQVSEAKVVVKAESDDYAVAEMTDCAINGVCPEACYSWCLFINCGGADLNSEYETDLTKCIPWGDELCSYRASRKGIGPSGLKTTLVPIPEIDHELRELLSRAYTGEIWVNATRAFADAVGQEESTRRLCPGMQRSGEMVGDRLRSSFGLTGPVLGGVVHLMNGLHKKNEECTSENGFFEGEVRECPFSQAPSEICKQYEAFFNGVCKAIDPDYEFAYDRKMTMGEQTCHWSVRKKTPTAPQKAKSEPDSDPIARLTNRFIDGEINEEEFRKKLAVLKELRL